MSAPVSAALPDGAYSVRIAALSAAFLVTAYVGLSAWTVALPEIAATFSVTDSTAQFGTSAMMVGIGVGTVLQAALVRRWGFRVAGGTALVLLIVGQGAIAVWPSFPGVLVFRFVQGAGVVLFVTVGLVTAWAGEQQRGLLVAAVGAAAPLGIGVGGLLTGWLLDAVGSWRVAFAATIPLYAVVGLCWLRVARDPPGRAQRVRSVATRKLWRHPAAMLAAGTNFALFCQQLGMFAVLPSFIYTLGYGATEAGGIVLICGLTAAVMGAMGGASSDVLVRRGIAPIHARALVIAAPGLLVGAVGCFLLPLLAPIGIAVLTLVAILSVWNFGGPVMGALPADLMAEPADVARVWGLLLVAGIIGGTVAPFVATAIESLWGYRTAISCLGAVAVGGTGLALLIPRAATSA